MLSMLELNPKLNFGFECLALNAMAYAVNTGNTFKTWLIKKSIYIFIT